jgi:quinoprotein glucose dehydrogenase
MPMLFSSQTPKFVSSLALALAALSTCSNISHAAAAKADHSAAQNVDWPVYLGAGGQHYSPLKQINTSNVGRLKQAWTYDTGEKGGAGLETTPIVVGNAIYAYTPSQKVIKLDAVTGKLLWTFDSGIASSQPNRGVSYWTDGKERRVLAAVMNYLYALDPETGKPISTFGENGRIDLRKGLRGDYRRQSVALTTPGTVYKDLIIVSGRMPEEYPAPPGDIRAFDVRTGALRWSFHTIPHPGEPGSETWPKDAWKYAGSVNNWCGMTVDQARGILYVPTGSAVFDFYGGDRLGDDLYANTLLALDANTGKIIWHFQAVHHDIWDRDLPSPPTLVTVLHDGKQVDAVAQTTKMGFVYVLDRMTGKSLFPIEQVKTLPSNVPGEVASPTQPKPTLPEPFTRQNVTADDLTDRTPEAHAWAEAAFKKYRSEGQFVPFSLDKLSLITPGFDGGAEWGGSAFDPASQVLYVNGNNTSWFAGLVVPPPSNSEGETLYNSRCSMCHGADRAGQPPAFPSLVDIHSRMTDTQIAEQTHNGKGRMPAFPDITEAQIKQIIQFLAAPDMKNDIAPQAREMASTPASSEEMALANKMPYKFTGYKKFLDPDGYPAVAPPWGTLNAIDLKTGKYLWRIPLGEYPELAAKGGKPTGSENYGGPVVTAGGVLFIAGTAHDEKMRAFDLVTGKLLWDTKLPYAGMATPTTYMVNGKQYVAIGAGGGKDTSSDRRGGVYVAYTLQ